MYAVIEDRGRQYKVIEGQVMDIDLSELDEGAETIEFDRVLLIGEGSSAKVGTPLVEGAKVIARIESAQIKGPKIYVVHFIRRKGHLTRQGHRQKHTRIRIEKIEA